MAGITKIAELKPEVLGKVAEEVDKEALRLQDDFVGFLPDEEVYDIDYAAKIVRSTSQLAGMIGFGAEPTVRDKDQVASVIGELAKFGGKQILTENELLKLHNPRSDSEFRSLVDSIIADGAQMVKETRDRINLTKAQAIGTGKVEFDNNNVKIDIDFTDYIPEEHKIVLSDNTWDDPEHDVIGDLLKWHHQYVDTNGREADAIYLSRQLQALLLKNAVIVNEAAGTATGRERVNSNELNSVLDGYGLPPVRIINRTKSRIKPYGAADTKEIEVFPENRVVFVAEGVGTFKLGPTVENDFNPGIVLQAYDKREPIQSILRVVAAGFPVIENPNLLLYADVIPEEGVEG